MINARHVNTLRSDSGGKYTTLMDYLNRRKIVRSPFVEIQEVAVSSADFVLVDSTTHLSGDVITVLTGTEPFATALTNGAVVCGKLGGAVGTASATVFVDALGNALDLVMIRDASTHNPIKTAADLTVFGILQCASTVSEGDAIGASASENVQISFVYVAADGTLTLATVTDTIEFHVNRLYEEGHVPVIYLEGGSSDVKVVEPIVQEPLVRKFVVTAAFAVDEILTFSGGAGSGSGTSTDTGDTVTVNASESLFDADACVRVRLNGVQMIKGAALEMRYNNTTTIKLGLIMDIGDVLEVETPIKFD